MFVAGFIGSSPMNLIKGSVVNGTFAAPGVRVSGLSFGPTENCVLGIRPEDVSILPKGKGHLTAPLYSLEPTGDQTLVAAKNKDQLIVARAGRNFRAEIDSSVTMQFDLDRIFIFDGVTGERVRK
jgi:multiple sugar transport system ATP-binding protein